MAPPEMLSRMPTGLIGRRSIRNVGMLKTMQICVFDPLGSQKSCLGCFLALLRTLPRPSRVVTLVLGVASGRSKDSPGAPRDPLPSLLSTLVNVNEATIYQLTLQNHHADCRGGFRVPIQGPRESSGSFKDRSGRPGAPLSTLLDLNLAQLDRFWRLCRLVYSYIGLCMYLSNPVPPQDLSCAHPEQKQFFVESCANMYFYKVWSA